MGLMYADMHAVVQVQDTDRAQYAFVRALSAKAQNIFFVGDPDQGIFEFRGADVRATFLKMLV